MEETTIINIGLLIVTGLAALLAWLSANRSTRAASESNVIQAKLVAMQESENERLNRERRQAILTAQNLIVHIASSRHDPVRESYIELTNSGAATARNITMQIGDKPAAEVTGLQVGQAIERIVVGPKSSLRLRYDRAFNNFDLDFPLVVNLEWDDESGERGSWTGTVL